MRRGVKNSRQRPQTSRSSFAAPRHCATHADGHGVHDALKGGLLLRAELPPLLGLQQDAGNVFGAVVVQHGQLLLLLILTARLANVICVLSLRALRLVI